MKNYTYTNKFNKYSPIESKILHHISNPYRNTKKENISLVTGEDIGKNLERISRVNNRQVVEGYPEATRFITS